MSKKLKTFYSVFFPAALFFNTAAATRVEINVESSNTGNLNTPYITDNIETVEINREAVLTEFFEKYNSPLKEHSDKFIEVADKYNIDYRLLPAISCIESSCGKRLIANSYNPFGWGIYGNKVTRFESYDHAIETVGEGLNRMYFERGLDTPERIAPVYTPPNSAHWLSNVKFFINKMDEVEQQDI